MSDVITTRLRVPLRRPQAVPEVSALLWEPGRPVDGAAGLVLAHGAGTDMTSPLLRAVARGLAEQGHPVLLFNFSYTEAGRKAPDPMPRLEACSREVAAVARERFGGRPLVLGGRSMGGRVASHLAAQGEPCDGLVFLGYPLHPPRRAGAAVPDDRLRTAHWPALRTPALFVQGDRDTLADLALLERERAARLAGPSQVHVVRGGDHGFAVRKRDGRDPADVLAEIVGVVAAWVSGLSPAAAEAGA
ncbi:MAG TPA: alpha/beta fold hydrolase [Egibacteraceae bacterium]|nr:alpha/beta fold hydrolase [Egibacteraceae bacterium]